MDNYKNLLNEQRNLDTIKDNLALAELNADAPFYTLMFNYFIETRGRIAEIKAQIQTGVIGSVPRPTISTERMAA